MSKLIIFALLLTIYSASAITQQQLDQCISSTCTTQTNDCIADTVCNATLNCLANCPPGSTQCYEQCEQPAINDVNYWAMNVCDITCMASTEMETGQDVVTCGISNGELCQAEFGTCMSDSTCVSAVQCYDNCIQIDYTCQAQCVIQYLSNANFMTLFGCEAQCFASFLVA